VILRLSLLLTTVLVTCGCTAPPQSEEAPPAPENYVYLYARLYESQGRETAAAQYLPNLKKTLIDYENTISVEEITNTEGEIEFIGIDFKIAAPESETAALETRLMDTFRFSGAPYATQIFIVTP
jgi:hypothetical protein